MQRSNAALLEPHEPEGLKDRLAALHRCADSLSAKLAQWQRRPDTPFHVQPGMEPALATHQDPLPQRLRELVGQALG